MLRSAALEKNLRGASILVVDDTLFSRDVLVKTLEKSGYRQVRSAANGQEAIEIMETWTPDLVFLDLMMPVMDGFETCACIRREERLKNTVVVIQTGVADTSEKKKAFALGADDYVVKPLDLNEVIARTALHLERKISLEVLENYRERIEYDMELASLAQAKIFPSDEAVARISSHYGMDLAGLCLPCAGLGGDYWGVMELPDNRFAAYLLDVTGHGVTSCLYTFLIHGHLKDLKTDILASPAALLGNLNQVLHNFMTTGLFATIFYAVFDKNAQKLTYAAAACPPALYRHGDTITHLETAGYPLGIRDGSLYKEKTLAFEPGDGLFFFSDALIENAGEDGKMLEMEDLDAVFAKPAPSQSYIHNMLNQLGINGKTALRDDLSICVVQQGSPEK